MDDTDGPYLLAWREFAIVETDLRRFEGVDVDPKHVVLLRLMSQDEIRSFCFLDDELGNFASLRRVLLAEEVLDSIEVVLAHSLFIHALPIVIYSDDVIIH